MNRYPKRLIEVDLPIKRISAHARREKSIRHGHISTLHIWWARRPLAACRAVICAALWPDPADELCPDSFRDTARELMLEWAADHLRLLGEESSARFIEIRNNPATLDDNRVLRQALLDFIADFSNWDNSTVREYLDTSRALTQAAHQALGGAPGTRPLVVDPFAGGGSIPLEALRVGADAFASDLNPVPVLLNKVVLEYIPKYGKRLADEVGKWGRWIKDQAEKELQEFYPKDPDGATPIAYLWARTIQCEGPSCGAEVPLIRSLWLAKKANRSAALQLIPNPQLKRVDFQIIVKQRDGWVDQDNPKTKLETPKLDGTVKRGSATCPSCGYTTPVAHVREQLKSRCGGANDARLYCIVVIRPDEQGRFYRVATSRDMEVAARAKAELHRLVETHRGILSMVPDESTEHYETFVNRGPIYGMTRWEHYYLPRQLLLLTTLSRFVQQVGSRLGAKGLDLAKAVQTCLAFVVDRQANTLNSLARWNTAGEKIEGVFARQALPMVWDFAEANSFSGATGDLEGAIEWVFKVIEANVVITQDGHAQQASATAHPMPDDSAMALITDPPYYYSVQYADLSDFFYVWLRRNLAGIHGVLFEPELTPKDDEIIVQSPSHQFAKTGKNVVFYESRMKRAMMEGRRVLAPAGIGVVVFAHTSTSGWEAQLKAMIDAGWIITGSWPIDTEMGSRVISQNRSVLASSVHLVCRPRENTDGSVRTNEIGDWRDVLLELPRRIHEWMPRLAQEGVVGADGIFACLGPALEIFSRYSRVEKASGEQVTLKEYLEYVWAAVAKEALNMIFEGADATGFEEDARLTAMWLWTLNTGANGNGHAAEPSNEAEETDNDDDQLTTPKKVSGYTLEFDAARKIAQGLGAHLEDLNTVAEVKGDKARLLPVAERAHFLFGKTEGETPKQRKTKKKTQIEMFDIRKLEDEIEGRAGGQVKAGDTTLDRVHQSMLLFASGRGEAMRRFLVEDGIGRDRRFWRLAEALVALYPPHTDERRWVEGVLARKKGLGF